LGSTLSNFSSRREISYLLSSLGDRLSFSLSDDSEALLSVSTQQVLLKADTVSCGTGSTRAAAILPPPAAAAVTA
jgi:hypothetical protein